MATLIKNINTPNWQLSPVTFGDVITDDEDVLQCIDNIIFTRRGDVPLNPTFGTDIYKSIDVPQNKIAPAVVSQIVQSVTSFEKRVRIDSVGVSGDGNGNVIFTLFLTVIASASQIKYSFNLSQIKSS